MFLFILSLLQAGLFLIDFDKHKEVVFMPFEINELTSDYFEHYYIFQKLKRLPQTSPICRMNDRK